jgi:transposase
MEYYVGLDVSLNRTSICVVNQTGSVVREGVVDSDPEAIAAFVRSNAPGAVRIGLETGPTATWLWTELKQLGLPVICIDARHAKAVTDDAETRGPSFRERRTFRNWRRIGTITFDRAVVSYNGDFVIHFRHPTWRYDQNDPATATRINERTVR